MAVVRKSAQAAAPAAAAPVTNLSAADEAALNVAGMDPDLFAEGGLLDDFDGKILKARFVPWDYNGTMDHHILAVAVTYLADGEDKPQTQHYSAGELDFFVPSNDGKTPVPLDKENATPDELEGIYALRVGKRDQLSNSSNWATFVTAAIEAGFPRALLRPSCTFVEGTVGHFNRVPQKKRSGIVQAPPTDPTKKERAKDILVLTELKQAPGQAPKTQAAPPAPAAPPATPAPAATSAEGDMIERVSAQIVPAVKAAGDGGLLKAALAPIMLKAFTGKEKAQAVKLVGDKKFLEESELWAYDPDSGTLYSLE